MEFSGRVTKDRKFSMVLVVTGVGSAANWQSLWSEILGQCHSGEGPVGVRYVREDATDRTIEAILLGEPAWRWKDGAGEGLSVGGSIMMTLPWQAPFPWWRDSAYNETTLTPSGSPGARLASRALISWMTR
jgi:hypothetical protein